MEKSCQRVLSDKEIKEILSVIGSGCNCDLKFVVSSYHRSPVIKICVMFRKKRMAFKTASLT